MKFQSFIFLISLLVLSQAVPEERVGLRDYREESLAKIKGIFEQNANNLGNKIVQIYQNTFIKEQFSKSARVQGLGEFECEKILKKSDLTEMSIKDKFYLNELSVNNYCPAFQDSQEIQGFQSDFQEALKDEQLMKIYYGFKGLGQNLQKNQQLLVETCQRVQSQFILQDGQAKKEKRGYETSTYYGSFAYEIIGDCLKNIENEEIRNKIIQGVKIPISSVMINSYQIEQGQIAIMEKDRNAIEGTARSLNAFLNIFENDQQGILVDVLREFRLNYQVQMVKFLKSQEDGILSDMERFELIRLYAGQKSQEYLFVRNLASLGTKQYTEVQFRWENLMGEVQQQQNINNESLVVALLDRSGKVLQQQLEIMENEKNESWGYKMKINTSNIQDMGYHKLRIKGQIGEYTWESSEQVYFVTKVKCDDLQFEVNDSKYSPGEYGNRLKEYEKILMPFEVSGDSGFIHLKFSLSFDRNKDIMPRQVGVALIHPVNGHTSTIVQAKYDAEKKVYKAKLNLSNPRVLLPYTNTYEGQLIVSDNRLRESISWKFAKFQISYKNPRQEKPYTGLEYKNLPEIEHTFKETKKQVPGFFIGFICLLVLGAFGIFLKMVGSIGVDMKLFPSGSANLYNIVFVLFVGVMLYYVIHFWAFINLYDLFIAMVVLVVPFYLSGRIALSYVSSMNQ